ncbi:MAG TPA: peptidoglycan-binding domain-containing protein [Solirubrobacteraceae bacterium]|nr:peptidoglycan-binding domain-containing protein [Solirubrobacteraceae bacterium]
MQSTPANKRSRYAVAVTAALALLGMLAAALVYAQTSAAESSVSGGTSPPGATTTTPAQTSPPAKSPSSSGGASSTPAKSPRRQNKSHSAARQPALRISGARCVPATACSTKEHEVSERGTLLLQGRGLKIGQTVAFPRFYRASIARNSPWARLRSTKQGLVVTVPNDAHSGDIEVVLGGGKHSNGYGPIQVVKYRLHPPAPKPKPAPPPAAPPTSVATTASGTAFAGQGMWIWYMSASDGGNVASIAAQAHAAGVTTLFIKSSDGPSNYWSQFSPQLVAELHADGLKVCAWQYVYGSEPVGEADLGAQAAADGAECLVIDAESQYEGHYAAAQRYIETLRAKVGPAYPVGLASFPYVNYHPSFPYSVFLGPNGAQFDVPQMYWHDIGTSVAQVYVNTFEQNLVYGRPILPLGQTYGGVSATEIVDFRSLASAYGAGGDSFWDWQESSATDWGALAAPLNTTLTVPQPELTSPLLKEGSRGDQVLWLQEHLASAVPGQPTTGIFEATTRANLEQFQTAHGIPATGETDPNTWAAVLALPPVAVSWTGGGPNT